MKKTKAILFTSGEAQEVELLEVEIIKETFSEHDFQREKTTINNGFLGATTSQETIIVGDKNIHALFFSDGSVYQVGYGFRSRSQHPPTQTREWIRKQAKALKSDR